MLGASGRLVGAAVMILSIVLLLIPIPMSNIVPAMVIVLVSLAWLEEDGLLLVVALLIAVLVVAVVVVAIWETILGVGWISRLWSS